MKSVVAITIEGVLRKPVGGTPIPAGIALYRGLAAAFNVVLLADFADDEELQHFLDGEMLQSHSQIAEPDWTVCSDIPGMRVLQVSRLRNSGYGIDLVVEPDPEVSSALYRTGFNVLHFMHAVYARPDWRPDWMGHKRTWNDLVVQEKVAAKLRAADARTGSMD